MILHVIGSRIHRKPTSDGSTVGTCAACMADVWLSPFQVDQMARMESRIECGECCRSAGGFSLLAVTHAAAAEYDRVLPNWRQIARERGVSIVKGFV